MEELASSGSDNTCMSGTDEPKDTGARTPSRGGGCVNVNE